MAGTRSCWFLGALLVFQMTADTRAGASRGSRQTGDGRVTQQDEEKSNRLSPLRVRRVVKPLSRERLHLFLSLYALTYFGADPSKQERLAYIVEGEKGRWTLVLAPRSGKYKAEKLDRPVPDGTVGIVHTHPRDKKSYGASPKDRQAVGIYKDVQGGMVRVKWNYIVHVNGILAVDAHGQLHEVAGRDWMSGLRADEHAFKLMARTP